VNTTHTQSLDGVAAFVFSVKNGGQQITVSGWYSNLKWKSGDFVVLEMADRSTRYKVKDIRHMANPPDQYFADMEFAPRGKT